TGVQTCALPILNGHERRLAQQRQVRDVSHRLSAGIGSRPERDQRERESESGEDAPHAVRRVAEDAARVVPIGGRMRLLRSHVGLTIVFASTMTVAAAIQNPPPGGRGGRGGGRGVQVMTLATPAWPDAGQIPAKHAQSGGEISPPLTWSNVPDGIVSFVLIVHDPDAATG